MTLGYIITATLFLSLPAIIANMLPPIAARFKLLEKLNIPIDGGREIGGKPIFGSHKTVRGYIVGTAGAIITSVAQYYIVQTFPSVNEITLYPYEKWLAIGFLLGFGALVGDSVESFFKRRANLKPGQDWPIWDQIDSIIGAIIFIWLLGPLPWQIIVAALVIGPVLHILTNMAGYATNLKER